MNTEIKIKVKNCPLIPINKLEIIQGNLKELSKINYDKLKGRIARLGFDAPIFVWKGKVLDGTQRIRTVQKMIEDGYSLPGNKLPIVEIQAKDINEAKERLLGYISQFGKVTDEGLYEFVHDIPGLDFDSLDLPDFNMDKFKIGWFEKEIAQIDEDDIPEIPKKAKLKRGQIYQLDRHRIMCGDSTCREDVDKLMNGKRADMVFTDPPYGIGYKYGNYKDIEGDEYLKFCNSFWKIIADYSSLIVMTAGWKYKSFWYSKNLYDEMVWFDKSKQSGGKAFYLRKTEPIFIFGKIKSKYNWDIIERVRDNEQVRSLRKLHTCPKPVGLIQALVDPQTKENQIVLDIFLGSGSTLIACEKTNRICYGMEIDPIYVDVIIQRWEDYTGKKAKLISKGS